MEHPHSLTVNGSGNSAGGDYNKVKIRVKEQLRMI